MEVGSHGFHYKGANQWNNLSLKLEVSLSASLSKKLSFQFPLKFICNTVTYYNKYINDNDEVSLQT